MKISLLLPLLLVLFALNSHGQRQVVAASGGYFEFSNGMKASWTVGEVATAMLSAPATNLILTQGFQQPDDEVDAVKVVSLEKLGVKVFPNPANKNIQIQVDNADLLGLHYRLYDLQGKLLKETPLAFGRQVLDISTLPNTSYLLIFSDADGRIASEKLLKVGL